MDRRPPTSLHQRVADLLEIETSLHEVAMVGRELDGAFVAQEVRRMEEVDVERGSRSTRPSRGAGAGRHGTFDKTPQAASMALQALIW